MLSTRIFYYVVFDRGGCNEQQQQHAMRPNITKKKNKNKTSKHIETIAVIQQTIFNVGSERVLSMEWTSSCTVNIHICLSLNIFDSDDVKPREMPSNKQKTKELCFMAKVLELKAHTILISGGFFIVLLFKRKFYAIIFFLKAAAKRFCMSWHEMRENIYGWWIWLVTIESRKEKKAHQTSPHHT